MSFLFPTPPAPGPEPLVPPHRPGPSWRSDRLDPGLQALAAGRGPDGLVPAATLEAFWRRCATRGTPLVHQRGDTSLLTFLWRDDPAAAPMLVQANRLFDGHRIADSLLAHLPGTDVWWAAFEVPAQWRGSYQFVRLPDLAGLDGVALRTTVREHATHSGQADPCNPRTVDVLGGRLRVAEGHRAPDRPWVARRPGVLAGSLRVHRLPGPRAGEHRRVWVHRPATAPVEGLLVLLDGEIWAERQPVTATLDNLAQTGATPGLQTVLVEAGDRPQRTRDLACDPRYAEWLLEEVLPTLIGSPPPERSIIAGQSLGGLAAMYLAHAAPHRFGNVLSQSGAFWFANHPGEDGAGPHAEWLTGVIRGLPAGHPRPRCHLEVGTLEWVSVPLVRRMRDVLRARGGEVGYTEYCGGHDTVCWQDGLATGLCWLTASW